MRSRKQVILLLTALYFAQGLPFGFFIQALPVVLRQRGYSLEAVGLTALLALPWALKFLWAPWVDRYATRQRWILAAQAGMTLLLLSLAAVGRADPALSILLAGVFGTNLLAATQDIATDGLAVRLLPEEDRGIANGIQVAAYRLGMILGGGAILAFFDVLGWSGAFLLMAGLVALTGLAVLAWGKEQPQEPVDAESASVKAFLQRPGRGTLIVGLIVFKAGESSATAMLRPMLVDRGMTLADIGWLLGTIGFVAGLLGALVGGWSAGHWPRRRVLTVFAILQMLAAASYAAVVHGADTWVGPVIAVEHFISGLATVALFTTMMDRCDPHSASTDYTVQASAVVIATGTAAALAGFSASSLGYEAHFLASAGFAALAIFVVPWLTPNEPSGAQS